MKILIAEDEVDLADALKILLIKNNFIVDVAYDGIEAYDFIKTYDYDALILDVMMPKMDGFTLIKKLRSENIKTPIMMLTARGEREDRILGFNSGADDYLPKPFDSEELVVRIRAMLRRKDNYSDNIISYKDLSFDKDKAILYTKDKSVSLNGKEYALMDLFMSNPLKVFSVDSLLEKIWGYEDVDIAVIWVHISNIRKKLKSIDSKVSISISRGLGYFLESKDV